MPHFSLYFQKKVMVCDLKHLVQLITKLYFQRLYFSIAYHAQMSFAIILKNLLPALSKFAICKIYLLRAASKPLF